MIIQISTYGLPSSGPWADEPLAVPLRCWDCPSFNSKVCRSADGITPTRRRLRTRSAYGIVLHSESYLVVALLMGLPPLGDDCGLTLLMRLFPIESPVKFAALLMGLPPLGDDFGPTLLMGLSLLRGLPSSSLR